MSSPSPTRNGLLYVATFVFGAVLMAGVGLLLTNIQQRKDEGLARPLKLVPVDDNEMDPAVWGQNFPREYERFMLMQTTGVRTEYGGSDPYSKLETNPNLKRLWAGYAFSVDFNEERSHYYALIDQKRTQRQAVVKQPGACANCHAGEAPRLIQEMGWEAFNKGPYAEVLTDTLKTGGTCNDCHDPATMALRVTRPAFDNALKNLGFDWRTATRQQMRSFVCMQCHVEYYFAGDNKVLTFPWAKGKFEDGRLKVTVDDIEAYYDEPRFVDNKPFKDWVHEETKAPVLKMQHPETELFTTSLHAANNVACADCHMPYIRDGAVKITDHWIRSPYDNVENACQTCHNVPAEDLKERINVAQDRTAQLLKLTEAALLDAYDAIVAARTAGATDADLDAAFKLQRRAQMRWDFISSENSTGFHSPQEAARVLAMAIDFARQSELAANQANPQK